MSRPARLASALLVGGPSPLGSGAAACIAPCTTSSVTASISEAVRSIGGQWSAPQASVQGADVVLAAAECAGNPASQNHGYGSGEMGGTQRSGCVTGRADATNHPAGGACTAAKVARRATGGWVRPPEGWGQPPTFPFGISDVGGANSHASFAAAPAEAAASSAGMAGSGSAGASGSSSISGAAVRSRGVSTHSTTGSATGGSRRSSTSSSCSTSTGSCVSIDSSSGGSGGSGGSSSGSGSTIGAARLLWPGRRSGTNPAAAQASLLRVLHCLTAAPAPALSASYATATGAAAAQALEAAAAAASSSSAPRSSKRRTSAAMAPVVCLPSATGGPPAAAAARRSKVVKAASAVADAGLSLPGRTRATRAATRAPVVAAPVASPPPSSSTAPPAHNAQVTAALGAGAGAAVTAANAGAAVTAAEPLIANTPTGTPTPTGYMPTAESAAAKAAAKAKAASAAAAAAAKVAAAETASLNDRYVSLQDASGVYPGNAMFVGSHDEWYAAHLGEVLAAPARGPGVAPPSRDDFELQLKLEARCRNLSLEQYKKEYEELLQRQAVECALPARKLITDWVPQLTEAIERRIAQFMALEDAPPKPSSSSSSSSSSASAPRHDGLSSRTLPVLSGVDSRTYLARLRAQEALPMDQAIRTFGREAPNPATTTAAAAAASELSSGSSSSSSSVPTPVSPSPSSAAAVPPPDSLRDLMDWVPLVKPVPPPLLARAIVGGLLNKLVLSDGQEEGDMPRGVGLSTYVADALGRQVTDMVMYMEVCHIVSEKRRALLAAQRQFAQMKSSARVAQAEVEEAEEAAAKAAMSAEADRGSGGGSLGGGGGGDGLLSAAAEKAALQGAGEEQVAQAAAAVRAARWSLDELQVAAQVLRPEMVEGQVLKDGTTADSRRKAAPMKVRGASSRAKAGALSRRTAALGQRTQEQLRAAMEAASQRAKEDELEDAFRGAMGGAVTAVERVAVTREWQGALRAAAAEAEAEAKAGGVGAGWRSALEAALIKAGLEVAAAEAQAKALEAEAAAAEAAAAEAVTAAAALRLQKKEERLRKKAEAGAAAAAAAAGLPVLNGVLRARLEAARLKSRRVQEWDQPTRVQVGASLMALALQTLHVTNSDTGALEPAFSHTTRAAVTFNGGGYQTPGMVIVHPQVLRKLEGDKELQRLLQPSFMPMVVEPRPWTALRKGAFLSQTVPIMKARWSPAVMERLRTAHSEGKMQGLYDALTVLGNVPWRINTRVLDVMEKVLQEGGGKLGLTRQAKQEMPQRFTTALNAIHKPFLGDSAPAQCGTPYLRLQREGVRGGQLLVGSGGMGPAEEEAYQLQCDAARLINRNESGQRCALNYRLEVARQYSGRHDLSAGLFEMYGSGAPVAQYGSNGGGGVMAGSALGSGNPVIFYQPHQIDFRGRAYPLHPHLHHLGDDGARGLLQFGVGRPLGERGFQWLLMQVANLWGHGVDKLPLAQRLTWAEEKLPAVRAVAAAPLEGGGTWWQGGERPWQLLGTCFEVAAALDSGLSSLAAFVSHQPVNQDGTCNGLQHYAALARDRRGGVAVNLSPADRPQDVYQAVADAVAERVARAKEQGRSEAAKIYGSVDRKLVKQTVMTYVYGVTIVGAREQIENRLEERGWTNQKERRKVATYLARITFESMGDVFGPAVGVRSWLEDCAKYAVSSGEPVVWNSPLGFPIEQPYRQLPSISVKTPMQAFTLLDNTRDAAAPLDPRKQRSGFPPNYIHSLDGAHMMMTARAVREGGACFAAVHDSFWTHAATVDDMNAAIRDTFIQLHQQDLLHDLRRDLLRNPLYRKASVALPPVPKPGDLDLSLIRDATYFFS